MRSGLSNEAVTSSVESSSLIFSSKSKVSNIDERYLKYNPLRNEAKNG